MSTVSINFTEVIPTPVNGYIVKYRQVGTSSYTTLTPNQTSSPITITGLTGGAYEGTINSECGDSSDSSGIYFTAGNFSTCGNTITYPGGSGFPSSLIVDLGPSTGTITLNCNSGTKASKFIVTFDGVPVINTGYIGSTSQQGALDTALTGMSLPTETITSPSTRILSFTKSTSTTTALVQVYDPLEGLSWSFSLGCPI